MSATGTRGKEGGREGRAPPHAEACCTLHLLVPRGSLPACLSVRACSRLVHLAGWSGGLSGPAPFLSGRKLGDGLFLRCCEEVAELYPKIKFDTMIIDNCCMQVGQPVPPPTHPPTSSPSPLLLLGLGSCVGYQGGVLCVCVLRVQLLNVLGLP